jgi:anaerobic ribonucleoside-triphosphate reductase activating protein
VSESSLKRPSPTTSLEEILDLQPPVGGWVPFSSIDDPGHLATVLFLEGCPWRCSYCHNRHLWTRHNDGTSTKVLSFVQHLSNRRGLLDSVVVSGGEPTSFVELPKLVRCIQPHFRVALHSGGAEPETFRQTLSSIDWVGFDFKTSWDNYAQLTRSKQSGEAATQSLRYLLESKTPYEIRTTVSPAHHTPKILVKMLDELIALNIKTWFLQEGRQDSKKRLEGLDELLSDAFIDQLRGRADDSKIQINLRHADGSQSSLSCDR